MRSAVLALPLLFVSSLALAVPPPPGWFKKQAGSGPTNVKVRRIGEVKMESTNAPPPATALTGKHKLLVVLVETAESPWPKGQDRSRFEEMLFAKSASSLREYYKEVSYGLFEVDGKVVGPIRVPGKMEDYTFQMGDKNDRVRRLIEHAIKGAMKSVDLLDFDTHDVRGKVGADGVLDHFMVVYSEKTGGPQGFSPIWPHRGSTDFDAGKVRVNSYTILNHGAPLGVYVHEFAHDIGLPDLYDRDYTSHGSGAWCLMASGSWADIGVRPSHISAWGKIRLGWIVPTVIAKPVQNYEIPAASEKPFALKLPIGAIDSPEYFLIENRRKVGFDDHMPAEGLLIWHIDERKGDNDDEGRKMVDVVEASPVQDLDVLDQSRDPDYLADIFTAGGKDTFDDGSSPSAKTNDGKPSNIRVRVLSKPGRVMTVDISRPEIFNPGGLPYVLEKDGYRFGRFATVPTGKGSEALVQLEATPGGYLVFGADAFVAGQPNTKGSVTIQIYEDGRNAPGRVLLSKNTSVTTQADGFAWVNLRMAADERGFPLKAGQRVWVGVASDDGKLYPALNPFSTSKTARFRRDRSTQLVDKFNFASGPEPIADYVIRLNGFGFLQGPDRPEPLATEADELVQRMRKADTMADKKKFDEALGEYEVVLREMEKQPRKFDSWIPVVVNSIGVAAYELKKWDLALERFETSLRRAQAAKDQPNEADIFENLGETAFLAGKIGDARKHCDRSRRINTGLARKDRLVENLYWIGRTHQVEKNEEQAKTYFTQALETAEEAFKKDQKELGEWRERIRRALDGRPEDQDKVSERTEKLKEDPTAPKEKAQYKDLMQFLEEDTAGK